MKYKAILEKSFNSKELKPVHSELKFVKYDNIIFPILFCQDRAMRPYRHYEPLSKDDCPLCMCTHEGKTNSEIIQGFEWMPASWPIKTYHGICYPCEHRAGILISDICALGSFADMTGDIIAGINMFGSAASIPGHFHVQIHDNSLPCEKVQEVPPAFPLLSCQTELIKNKNNISLFRISGYPAFVLLLQGAWEVLGRWIIAYLAATNVRPHNFAIAPGGRLFIIPRGNEKAPSQENKYGTSEMLGLITPVTRSAYEAIDNGNIVSDALKVCSIEKSKEKLAIEEHVIWAIEYIGG